MKKIFKMMLRSVAVWCLTYVIRIFACIFCATALSYSTLNCLVKPIILLVIDVLRRIDETMQSIFKLTSNINLKVE